MFLNSYLVLVWMCFNESPGSTTSMVTEMFLHFLSTSSRDISRCWRVWPGDHWDCGGHVDITEADLSRLHHLTECSLFYWSEGDCGQPAVCVITEVSPHLPPQHTRLCPPTSVPSQFPQLPPGPG